MHLRVDGGGKCGELLEKYGAVSFDPGQKAVLTSCVLRTKNKAIVAGVALVVGEEVGRKKTLAAVVGKLKMQLQPSCHVALPLPVKLHPTSTLPSTQCKSRIRKGRHQREQHRWSRSSRYRRHQHLRCTQGSQQPQSRLHPLLFQFHNP